MNRRRFLKRSALAFSGLAVTGLPGLAHAQATPITIGQSVDLSGPTQSLGRDYFSGAKLCFDVSNAAGGIGGRPLRLLQLDDGGQAARAVANVARLLNQERVDHLFGLTGDACIAAALNSPAFARSDKLLFAPMSGADYAAERVVYLRASYGEEIAAILATLSGAGLKAFTIAHAGTAAGIAARDAAFALLKKRGLGAPDAIALPADPRQMGVAASGILNRRPQAVVILADTIPTALLARELRSRNPGLFVCATSCVDPTALRQIIGAQTATGIVLSRVVPDPLRSAAPSAREFSQAFNRYFDEAPSCANFEGYLAAKLLVNALRKAGPNPDSPRLLAALHSQKTSEPAGWKIDFGSGRRASHFVDTIVIRRNGDTLG
ncbi:ABC transporter substrate-binding protein [Niveibacterium terrae]|uniref:ABC transporter substrate-binding protein n=1 Tax=Niveibacterium terrae TaxID=3373598 RepID=UPI003A9507A2